MRILSVGAIASCLTLSPVAVSLADSIAITNPNFNYTTNGDGSFPPNTVAGAVDPSSTYVVGVGSSATLVVAGVGNDGTATLAGWTAGGAGYVGADNLGQSYFNTPYTGALAFIGNTSSTLTQAVGNLASNTTYALSVNVYSRNDFGQFSDYSPVVVQLQDGAGNNLGGQVTTTPFVNGEGTYTLTLHTGNVASPTRLRIVLGESTVGTQVHFDDVQLTDSSAATPLPSAALAGIVLLGGFGVSTRIQTSRCRRAC